MTMSKLSKIKNFEQLARSINQDPELAQKMKEDPVRTIEEITAAHVPDTVVYRIVVVALGLAILVALAGAIAIAMMQLTIPDILLSVASAAVGALAGLLTPLPPDQI